MKTILSKSKLMVLVLGLLASSSLLSSCGFYCGDGYYPDPIGPVDPIENPKDKPLCEG